MISGNDLFLCMYLFKRDYAKAESCYKRLCSSNDRLDRVNGRVYLSYIPLYQGKFKAALGILEDGIIADKMEQVEEWYIARKKWLKSVIYRESNLDLAISEIEQYVNYPNLDSNLIDWLGYYSSLLAEKGDFKKAKDIAEFIREVEANRIYSLRVYITIHYTARLLAYLYGSLPMMDVLIMMVTRFILRRIVSYVRSSISTLKITSRKLMEHFRSQQMYGYYRIILIHSTR